jgi:demethylmenaquinone methyltransferase/2-methoxy-6-polyprenyl-1,4-benzoquinol methylase
MEKVKPYINQQGTKKEQVESMFNSIAPRYDLLNRWLSFGIDKLWRKRVVNLLSDLQAASILDVATGTADLALEVCRIKPAGVQAIDISEGMLRIAQQKVLKYGRQHTIHLRQGDSENLPFEKNLFDAVMVAFGVRNFEDLQRGLGEMARVLKPGGRLVVLEFSKPSRFPFKQLYNFYFSRILPWWGGLISQNRAAYTYLPASVKAFPEGPEFEKQLVKAGLVPVKSMPQTFGIATIYLAEKKG